MVENHKNLFLVHLHQNLITALNKKIIIIKTLRSYRESQNVVLLTFFLFWLITKHQYDPSVANFYLFQLIHLMKLYS